MFCKGSLFLVLRALEWRVASGEWLVAGGWWLVAGGWWLVARNFFTAKDERNSAPLLSPAYRGFK